MIKLHLNGEPEKADLSRRLKFMSHDGILFFRAMGNLYFDIFLTFGCCAKATLPIFFLILPAAKRLGQGMARHFHTFIHTLSYTDWACFQKKNHTQWTSLSHIKTNVICLDLQDGQHSRHWQICFFFCTNLGLVPSLISDSGESVIQGSDPAHLPADPAHPPANLTSTH